MKHTKARASQWYYIGLELHLKPSDMETIDIDRRLCEDKLRDCLKCWLEGNVLPEYREDKPKWSKLIEVIAADNGGNDPALADEIGRKLNADSHHDTHCNTDASTYTTGLHDPSKDTPPSTRNTNIESFTPPRYFITIPEVKRKPPLQKHKSTVEPQPKPMRRNVTEGPTAVNICIIRKPEFDLKCLRAISELSSKSRRQAVMTLAPVKINGHQIIVHDCIARNNTDIQELTRKCHNPDLVLFCTQLLSDASSRQVRHKIQSEDANIISGINRKKQFWSKTLFVLSKDYVEEESERAYDRRLKARRVFLKERVVSSTCSKSFSLKPVVVDPKEYANEDWKRKVIQAMVACCESSNHDAKTNHDAKSVECTEAILAILKLFQVDKL